MLLSIIIVHHNAPEYLRTCLQAIPKAGLSFPLETIVVDNASEGAAALAKEHPEATWILNPSNVGWGTAVNQGAAKSSGDILVLLNPDAELCPEALPRLHDFFMAKQAAQIGPVGGKLLFSDGTTQPSCGPFPSLANLLWRRILPATKRKYYLSLPMHGTSPVDWVTGAFLAVRRSVFQELDGFDKGFFLYYEDVDLCIRARQKGYPSVYFPETAAYHHHPHAVRTRPDPVLKRIIRDSRLYYFKKHRPAWEHWALAHLIPEP